MAGIFETGMEWKDIFMKAQKIYLAPSQHKEIQNHDWMENEEFSLAIEYKTQGLNFYTQPNLARPKSGSTVYPVTRNTYINPATMIRAKVIFSAPRVITNSKIWYEYYTYVDFTQDYVCFFITPYPSRMEYDFSFFDDGTEIIGFACRLKNVELSKE